jgi:hypothetical protein
MIQRLNRSYPNFCVVCKNWDNLSYRDPTLSQAGLCTECALAVIKAERELNHAGLTQPPSSLAYSLKHRL